ncbi:50S ribosomal protein L23 [Candidatus Zinderia endosymbiont of Aphrophora alni]|uniref:50S ribosomal protein L23 n=1 Tax=Candidatus Zinderia endosymbiont of Aphrophora alni TaxID=3077951 RepID=UPI0030D5EFA3
MKKIKTKYSKEHLTNILLNPIISNKNFFNFKNNKKIIFLVSPKSNKLEIKFAVERMLKVKVKSVCVLNRKGKKKRFKNFFGYRKNTRRAFVTLKNIKNINLLKDIIK